MLAGNPNQFYEPHTDHAISTLASVGFVLF